MKIPIIGANGMLGRKLARRLAGDGTLGGCEIEHLVLVDVFEPSIPEGWESRAEARVADLSEPGMAVRLIESRRTDRGARTGGGEEAVALIRREPDPGMRAIVGGWAEDLDLSRARTRLRRRDLVRRDHPRLPRGRRGVPSAWTIHLAASHFRSPPRLSGIRDAHRT